MKEYYKAGGWETLKDLHPNGLDLIVTLGQSARRHLHENIWVDVALDAYERSDKVVVIPDVRQQNEYDAIKARGGIIGRVRRPSASPRSPLDSILERAPVDFVIHNDGDLKSLTHDVEAVAHVFGVAHS